jgi:hypothetical protein
MSLSKFGRAWPVLNINVHILKLDPPKYYHNLRKFGKDFISTYSTSIFPWQLQG